jgi:hypothetical protein
MKNNRKPVKYLRLCFLVLQYLPLFSTGQSHKDALKSTAFNIYNLNRFGNIYVPKELDTFNQRMMKDLLAEQTFERIDNNPDVKIKNKLKIDQIRANYKSIDSNSILFWPASTITRMLSTEYILSLLDSTEIDPSDDVQYVPNIMINKSTVRYHSNSFLKYYFNNRDSTNKLILEIKTSLTHMLSLIYPEARVKPLSTENFIIENKYPVIGVHFELIFLDGDKTLEYNYSQYSLMKGYNIYNLKYEYFKNTADTWRAAIKNMILKSQFL